MGRSTAPELKQYMDKKLLLQLNADRRVIGRLRGYDAFMNLNLEDAHEVISEEQSLPLGQTVVRGNSIIALEALEPIGK
ncbi:small nuclear ribonucleo protein [Coemansia reversa NRRL 1564]|uniref:Small nuclear ribonucleoprotein G n=1 Tax=Coemansia reversa (strain ATCC 12441 / NRRL 1564) TaxID=763665 RepID=A0A2G5B9Z3_COERN|nr:small nuclear ribonucleo protein [Coemansia reversa NRRL 1564]|eukprot:PIA15823.1 small nuclear ribonucleo protein [Coemansia reversa NRRL 1564]